MSVPGVVHECAVRVRYGEVDRMGYLYHAHYLVYFEVGRTELLRAWAGASYRSLEDAGTLLVVVESGVRHLRPARYDDLLAVRTRLEAGGPVRLRFAYEVLRGEELLATGHTVLAAASAATGRPCRLPPLWRARLAEGAGAGGKPAGPVGVQVERAPRAREEAP